MMNPYYHSLGAAALFFGAAVPLAAQETSCPLTADETAAFEQYIALPALLAPVLESATDTASADAAAPRLHEQLDAVYNAREALHGISKLSPEQLSYVQTRYARRMREEWARVYDAIFRIQKAQCYHSVPFTKEFGNLNMMLAQ